MARWEFSVPAMKVVKTFNKYKEKKMDKENIFTSPKAKTVKIEETVTGGFIVSVGCKQFAFGRSPEEISRLSDYLRTYLLNPREVERMSNEAAGEDPPEEATTHEEAGNGIRREGRIIHQEAR